MRLASTTAARAVAHTLLPRPCRRGACRNPNAKTCAAAGLPTLRHARRYSMRAFDARVTVSVACSHGRKRCWPRRSRRRTERTWCDGASSRGSSAGALRRATPPIHPPYCSRRSHSDPAAAAVARDAVTRGEGCGLLRVLCACVCVCGWVGAERSVCMRAPVRVEAERLEPSTPRSEDQSHEAGESRLARSECWAGPVPVQKWQG